MSTRFKFIAAGFVLTGMMSCGSPQVHENNETLTKEATSSPADCGDSAQEELGTLPVEAENNIPPMPSKIIPEPHMVAFSGGGGSSRHSCCNKSCEVGAAGYNDPERNWYVVDTEAYPIVKPLSINRRFGDAKGSVELTDTGLKVNAAGTYWVSYLSTIAYFTDMDYTPLIPIFLIKNDNFDPNDTASTLGITEYMPPNAIKTLTGSGVMFDLKAGDTLSMVITNGGSPQPMPITVLAWNINAFRICD